MKVSADIIKSQGRRPTESFERTKLHDSIVAACLSVRAPEGQAETTAHAVCEAVTSWLEPRAEVTSEDIRRVASKHLTTYHPDAAYLYEQHRIVI